VELQDKVRMAVFEVLKLCIGKSQQLCCVQYHNTCRY